MSISEKTPFQRGLRVFHSGTRWVDTISGGQLFVDIVVCLVPVDNNFPPPTHSRPCDLLRDLKT